MNAFLKKLASRKFIVAAAGIASGIVLIVNGSTTEGVGAVIASVLGYLVAEGYIDAKAVQTVTDKVEDALEESASSEDFPGNVVEGFASEE